MENNNYTKEELLLQIEQLKAQLQQANDANVAKETFLSNMSHDIRTPMNAIVGMTALAKKHIDEKHRVIDALNKIDTASAHLLNLINDVLDMSRINSGRMTIASERFSLSELIHDTLIIIKPLMESKSHSFQLTIDDTEDDSFYGDSLRLKQILVNIISNAAKYTDPNGKIVFSVYEEVSENSKLLCFKCTDNGIGMSAEFVSRIFNPFERVNNSTISKVEGTGLGMSIVKKIVDAMNGTIEVKSSLGEGTEVLVKLPLKPVEEKPDYDLIKTQRILIIEADEALIKRYQKILGDAGVDYVIVPSAADAIPAITDAGFTGKEFSIAIIGEKRANSGNIYEIASYITGANSNTAVVLASSDNWEEIEYQAQRSGIKGFIPLPFFKNALISGLKDALGDEKNLHQSGRLPDLTGKVILLAEDNFINREIACEMLSATNALIETAEDGKQAVDAYMSSEEGYFSIILMDIQMPHMNGYEATKAIRQSGRKDSNLPIYAMTANTFAEDIAKAREHGMNGHIAKPIDVNTLMQALTRALI